MSTDEIQANAPIWLSDGAFGLVIRFGENEIGVQVPGEEEIRWVPIGEVSEVGAGALVQIAVERRGDSERL